MAERRLRGVLERLRGLAGADGSTDAELLGRFVAERDAAALETLVRRYGPMVWGVCRRVLRDAHDAEDAFQAAFLVLVRKAASIARRELLGNWLYGVARRTALEARAAAARRRVKEREAAGMPKHAASPTEAWREALPLLDQELARLPNKYRIPILLCDLQGKSRRDAARQLRLPEGTLSSRLARGRVLLVRRLGRHGLTVAGGALAAALAADAASAGVPPLLTAATVRAALSFAASSVRVTALVEGVFKAMLWTKLKIAAAMVLTAAAAAGATAAFRAETSPLAAAVKARPSKPAPTDDGPLAFAGDKGPAGGAENEPPAAGDHDDGKAAVDRGLRWLALHQARDGHWSLDQFQKFAHKEPTPDAEPFTDDSTGQAITKSDAAATAFAVLPFLGAGHTHKPPKEKADMDYSKTVDAGLRWLIARQDNDGAFDAKSAYANALAAMTLCEACGLTSDPALRGSAQKALKYIEDSQDPAGGGWRYSPKMPGDLSVTGWQVAALESGQMAGLDVDKDVLRKAQSFVDSCETKTHHYSYLPGGEATPTMTAVGMVCRRRLGVDARNPRLVAGEDVLRASPPGKAGNIYYDYYATQAMAGRRDAWKFWGEGEDGKGGARAVLLADQDHDPKKPADDGSWPPVGPWKTAGGRVMQTSLSLLILEVYYQRSPLFGPAGGAPREKE